MNKIDWLETMKAEIALLQDLSELARASRGAAISSEASGLEALLSRQAEVCAKLERVKSDRQALLESKNQSPRDFLVVVLGCTPKEKHQEVIALFGDYVRAAEASKKEIDINRDHFRVALAALENTLQSVTGELPVTYDPLGANGANRPSPLRVSVIA